MSLATPVTVRPVRAEPSTAPSGPQTARSIGVLIVEDDPVTSEVFARALQREGHSVQVARDGLQALHALRDTCPDLLVLDLGLPHLPGKELLQRLRQGEHPNTPVIVVSGAPHRPAGLDADLIQPGRWLDKPLRPRELVAVVRELLPSRDGPGGGDLV